MFPEKGQVSIEYIIILALFLVLLSTVAIPLYQNAMKASRDVSKTATVKTALDTVADAVDMVGGAGPDTRRTVKIRLPANITGAAPNGTTTIKYISFTVGLSDETKGVTRDVRYYVNGTLPKKEGWHTLQLEASFDKSLNATVIGIIEVV